MTDNRREVRTDFAILINTEKASPSILRDDRAIANRAAFSRVYRFNGKNNQGCSKDKVRVVKGPAMSINIRRNGREKR